MIRVTDASLCHIDAIEAMEKQCFSVPWTREMLIKQLPDDMHIFLAAVDDNGEAVGYVGLMYVLDEGYISNVAVSPEMRRQGIGDMLIDELILRARAKKLSFVTLEVRETNLAAQGLYKKHGFTEVGRRRNYYELPTEDAILMTRFLGEEER
ncbi:MAG: ribosomal protein S18-alanine N-acetyltransferase [Oscillospiraceae bacterium]